MRRLSCASLAFVVVTGCGSDPADPTGGGGSDTTGSTTATGGGGGQGASGGSGGQGASGGGGGQGASGGSGGQGGSGGSGGQGGSGGSGGQGGSGGSGGQGGSGGSGGQGGSGGSGGQGGSGGSGGQGGSGGGEPLVCAATGAWSAVSLAAVLSDGALSARADGACRVMAALQGKGLDLGTGAQSGWLVLANFAADGSVSSVRNIETSSSSDVRSAFIAPAPGEDFVVAIAASGDIDMGGGPIPELFNSVSFILARYDASGAFIDSWQYGEDFGYDSLKAVDVDAAGNIYVVGQLNGALDPDFGHPSDIVKLAPDGSLLWTKEYGDFSDDVFVVGAALGADDHLVVWGYLEGVVDFGAGLVGSNSEDLAFVLKLAPDGALVFGRTLPISENSFADVRPRTAATPDLSGGVWVSGGVFGPVDIGNGPEGTGGLLVAHVDGTGALVAADILGTSGLPIQDTKYMSVLSNGDLVLAGQIDGPFDFGGGVLAADTSLPLELFIARYDEALVHQESFTFGDGEVTFARADSGGGMILGGRYQGTLPWAGSSHDAVSEYDAFVARLPPPP